MQRSLDPGLVSLARKAHFRMRLAQHHVDHALRARSKEGEGLGRGRQMWIAPHAKSVPSGNIKESRVAGGVTNVGQLILIGMLARLPQVIPSFMETASDDLNA